MEVSALALELLSQLENREAELLSWGVVDGAFTEDEVYDEIEAFIKAQDEPAALYPTPDELFDELRDARLIWPIPPDGERYRTRMAEGVRLLFRLRQILHWRPEWRHSAKLIADYRLLLRARAYPSRHLDPASVCACIRQRVELSALDNQVIDALLALPDDKTMRLADFQVNATRRVLAELEVRGPMSGTIVCAGTGSGKTMSFYLPALISLARWSEHGDWTRCLSLYPRNELLKDQLSNAVAQVSKVNRVLVANGRRTISVGALFGAVPRDARAPLGEKSTRDWRLNRDRNGWRCPYLSCPSCEAAELDWLDPDRKAGTERLVCANCSESVGPDLFRLTRDSMTAHPPDLLFSSLEMLNQRISDPQLGRLFGLGGLPQRQRPRLVLLDEVHTYEGVHGAQAALVLRRWKQFSGANPHFVGLSATLADAQRFFAELVDLDPKWVDEVSPRDQDMEDQGQEYMLAMRGDPISDTNLLSASIQAAMLLRRLLDPSGHDGVSGTKVFGFTDDLDVTNRLYHDLLDAEGWELHRGRRQRLGRNRINKNIDEFWLATYRASQRGDLEARRLHGQSWELCEDIGHRLVHVEPPVKVGRTSSQDSGVDPDADIVIATASLEVGYDDDQVGAVLQHKAPMSDAAFLQRKGRAGRQRAMRPWTVVMLSAYGRDRIAYEGYERLFSPELQPRHLPVNNRNVLRIQATYALMDWFESKGVDAHIWRLLSLPPVSPTDKGHVERIIKLTDELLAQDTRRQELAAWLRQSLQLDDDTVQALMWDPPRSLIMSVLPTLHRRLSRRWNMAVSPGAELRREPHVFWSPLPEFVPRALFTDLNLPEVCIQLPGIDDPPSMPILQALKEFAPGRVTLRFGVNSREDRHWVPVDFGVPGHQISIDGVCPPEAQEELGLWWYLDKDTIRQVRVVRPFALRVQATPDPVQSSSSAQPNWRSQLLPPPGPTAAVLPRGSNWQQVFGGLRFYIHAHANPIEVRRFTLGSFYTGKVRGGDSIRGAVNFVDGAGQSAALGFSIDVDALGAELKLPDSLLDRIGSADPTVLRGLRVARLSWLLHNDEQLAMHANHFQVDWLCRVALAALVLAAARDPQLPLRLDEAFEEILSAALRPLEVVLEVIFPVMGEDESGRMKDLRELIGHATFREALVRHATCLWEPLDARWEPWLRRRLTATLAIGLKEAAQQFCADLDAGQLCVDIDSGLDSEGRPGPGWIWLSETTVGGGGFIEALFREYTADPRRFFGLLEAALGPNEFEDIHSELSLLLRWLQESSERGEQAREALDRVRRTRTHAELRAANQNLRTTLAGLGMRVSHPVMSALSTRILRPGSNTEVDALLARLLASWERLEERLGIEIDAYVIAYLHSERDDLDQALDSAAVGSLHDDLRQWRFGTLHGLLWPRGQAVRAQGLQAWNPYHPLPESDRLLVGCVLDHHREDIPLEQPHWRKRVEAALLSDGVVSVSAPLGRRPLLARCLKELQVDPIDQGYLLTVPRVRGVGQENERLVVILELAEAIQ